MWFADGERFSTSAVSTDTLHHFNDFMAVTITGRTIQSCSVRQRRRFTECLKSVLITTAVTAGGDRNVILSTIAAVANRHLVGSACKRSVRRPALIFGTPAYRSVPAPRIPALCSCSTNSAHAPFYFLIQAHRSAHLDCRQAPLHFPLRSGTICL